MAKPKRGDVWLVRFPFTDLTTTKVRPALVVATHGDDIIVIGIFSRVPSTLRATWILIDDQHTEFGQPASDFRLFALCP
jgi:mRNA interferase MazF